MAGIVDVIFPVLDEAAALPWLLPRMPDGYRAIVVDNGSTDGSAEIARSFGALVVEEPVPGFGSACWAGLEAATADVVCFADGDASCDPAELPLVAGPIIDGRADLVLGSRQPEPGAWPVHARIANRYLARRLNRKLALDLTDLGPMRAARRVDLLELSIEDRRFGWPLEMVLRAGRAGWRIDEVPVTYRAREGRSKVTGTVKGTVAAVRDMGRLLR